MQGITKQNRKMINELGLFYEANSSRGPRKVADNLAAGLTSIGVKTRVRRECDYNGCLHSGPDMFKLPEQTLVGPNCVVLPSDDPKIFSSFKYHVCPSEHIKNLYEGYPETKNCDISIWPAGIDTNMFYDFKKKVEKDCFIYFKNRTRVELQHVVSLLDNFNLTAELIQYGHYNENELINLIKKCRFCILLTGTESQGIGYMEILATNTPCYVLDKNRWEDRPGFEYDATSTPYFDERCGIKASGLERLDEFLDKLNSYSRRQYIVDNHTLEKSAQDYINLIERSHK